MWRQFASFPSYVVGPACHWNGLHGTLQASLALHATSLKAWYLVRKAQKAISTNLNIRGWKGGVAGFGTTHVRWVICFGHWSSIHNGKYETEIPVMFGIPWKMHIIRYQSASCTLLLQSWYDPSRASAIVYLTYLRRLVSGAWRCVLQGLSDFSNDPKQKHY